MKTLVRYTLDYLLIIALLALVLLVAVSSSSMGSWCSSPPEIDRRGITHASIAV